MIARAFEAIQSTFIRSQAYTDRPRNKRHETEQMERESTTDSTRRVK